MSIFGAKLEKLSKKSAFLTKKTDLRTANYIFFHKRLQQKSF